MIMSCYDRSPFFGALDLQTEGSIEKIEKQLKCE